MLKASTNTSLDYLASEQQQQRIKAWRWPGYPCHLWSMQLLPQLRRVSKRRWVSLISKLQLLYFSMKLTIVFLRPFFVKGCAIGCGFTGSIVIMALGLYLRMRIINKKRDALHGPVKDSEQIDVTDLGEKHPSFRYLL